MTTFLFKLRNRHFFMLDLLTLSVIPTIALILRLDGLEGVSQYLDGLLVFTLLGLVAWVGVFLKFSLDNRYWRYASVDEITLIVAAVATATAASTICFFLLRLLLPFFQTALPFPLSLQLPRSVPVVSSLLMFISIGGSRLSIRVAEHVRRSGDLGGQPVLIIGAGNAGRMIAKELQHNPQLELEPVGFVDDDPAKQGMKIQGLYVLGSRDDIPQLADAYKVQQAIIAMPTVSGKTIRRFVQICETAGIQVKTIPGLYELLSGQVSINQIRSVQIEDLLRRDPVEIEIDQVERMIHSKRVLVTGAGGSIGAELCRQIAQCSPSDLILLGHGETSIFKTTRELRRLQSPTSVVPVIADIRDRRRLQSIFEEYRPHLVFHAAAHKHLPLMECNVAEAVTNNVLGTRCLIEAAGQSDVECFVLISTDKAVNPTSIMGVTKRVAEKLIVAAHNRQLASLSNLQLSNLQPSTHKPATRFTAVRFGNVLGSRGSVVNIFREQIARGGPVTVTHPDMRRYFMTIPEAVQLVLQAAAIGRGGEIFVLDMSDPVPIVELARDLIRLSGLELGRDIDIKYIGRRQGEKLFEELFADGEEYERTQHEKIFVCRNGLVQGEGEKGDKGKWKMADEKGKEEGGAAGSYADLEGQVDGLIGAAQRGDADEVRCLLREIVPGYRPAGQVSKGMRE